MNPLDEDMNNRENGLTKLVKALDEVAKVLSTDFYMADDFEILLPKSVMGRADLMNYSLIDEPSIYDLWEGETKPIEFYSLTGKITIKEQMK